MRSIIVLLAAITSVVFVIEPRVPSAGAHTVNNVEIMAQHSGKCLDNKGTTVWGEHVHQWACQGQAWQRWTVEHRDALWHRIRNVYSNMCLDVKYANPFNGAVVWQVDCNETDAQRWTVVGSAGAWVQLRSKLGYPGTAWCLDVQGAGQADAQVIWLYSCNGTQAQQWQIGQAYARGGMPFNGHWGSGPGDGLTDARPPVHHIVECEPAGYAVYDYSVNTPYCNNAGTVSHRGDWSVDVYAAAGTQVKYWGAAQGLPSITARVRAIVPTCDNDYRGGAAGNTVFVDIVGSQGQWYGWIAFSHLKEIAVSPNQVISPGQVLGKTEFWGGGNGVPGCYLVAYANGVHTHIEMWNTYQFACYHDWYSGPTPIVVPLSYGNAIGDIDRAKYLTERSACS